MRTAVAAQLREVTGAAAVRELKREMATLEKRIGRLDAEIRAAIAADPVLARRREILTSVPGIGPVTAAAPFCWMPGPGTLRGGQAASLIGVAPFARDSGTLSGARHIRGGRRRPRDVPSMAALTAAAWNPAMGEFYQRLTDAGKAHKVALVAVMRKLVIPANALLRDGRGWSGAPPAATP